MSQAYDIVLKNGMVIDPLNGRNGKFDVAIAGGRIVSVAEDLDPSGASGVYDLSGLYLIPGIIDLHVHASEWLGGRFAHRMLALAGVTTALDMAGPVDGVLHIARDFGAGLTIGCIQYARSGHTLPCDDPKRSDLEAFFDTSLEAGAIGVKILGGHFPLTPEASALAIEIAEQRRAYVAMHVGTTVSGSNLDGLHEALALAGQRALHLAHVNAYCRGSLKDYMAETEEALKAIARCPNICSESYLSTINGTSGKCSAGRPESQVTGKWLLAGGFENSEKGLEAAIDAGWALVNIERGGTMDLAGGRDGLAWWRRMKTDAAISFHANPPEPRIRLACAKNESGRFIVDCISTDGGGIPRNSIIEMGLGLVRLQAIDIEDFVLKTSGNPARILGLNGKGHLSEGADADITVVDLERLKPYMSIGAGRVISYRGQICGSGATIITTPAGEAHVRQNGLKALVVDPDRTPFLRR